MTRPRRSLPWFSGLILAALVVTAILAPYLAPHSPTEGDITQKSIPPVWMEGGEREHLLGTDRFGRDVLSRIVWGSRISLVVSLIAIGVAGTLGTALGLISGYRGGLTDAVLMRLTDVGLSLPTILIAVVMVAVSEPSFRNVILVVALLLWPRFARQVRGETLAVKAQDFVALAVVAGRSSAWIVSRHIFPNVVPTLLVISTLQVGYVILLEGTLSFLGVGVPPPNPAWGLMIADGRGFLATAWWISLFPGLAMLVTVLAVNLMGDWLRDHLDPRLRQLGGQVELLGPAVVEPAAVSHDAPARGIAAASSEPAGKMRVLVALLTLAAGLGATAPATAAPEGQVTWGVHISLAPTWFDPAETPGIGTPFMILYALHDALVKPMPGQPMALSLAESWSASKDGLVHEFVLRPGARFHNGDPVTADDVKFSFERYRGAAARLLKERVLAVEVVDPSRVRFRLKEPWPDFMTYYGSLTTGAGWIVPKKYLEKVGDEGFKKAPVGAGPYRFVSFTPGVELVLEAYEHYWRKVPSVKRLVLKSIPDEATRLAALKRGEADVVYLLQSELAEEARRTPGLTLRPTPIVSTHWLVFLDQWDPKSPWADRRVRLAANHAIDRQAINEAITLGFSRITWSVIPQSFDFYWQPPAYAYDPARAKQLLAEAGYPKGFDAGDLWCDAATATMSEAVISYLQAVGIRVKLRPLERAAFFKGYQEKKLKNLLYSISGAFGNAAIRLETFVVSGGPYVYGGYPDIDGLFREQAAELDRKRRETMLHKIQQLIHEKAMYAPIWELGFIHAQGPRLAESGLGLITGWAFSAPYEDVKLKGK